LCADDDREYREREGGKAEAASDYGRLVNVAVLTSAEPTATRKVAAEHVFVALVNRWSDMIELGDEGVFKPVHKGFGEHDS
jgi:hypothetical protein